MEIGRGSDEACFVVTESDGLTLVHFFYIASEARLCGYLTKAEDLEAADDFLILSLDCGCVN